MFVNNIQCKHILLGVAHDNGYVPTLDLYKSHPTTAARISLLKPTNIGREYLGLPFEFVQFNSIFRVEELPYNKPSYANQAYKMTLRQPVVSPTRQDHKSADLGTLRPFYPRPVYLNKSEERVDESLSIPNDRAEAKLDQRIRNTKKLCNDYHLRGDCRKPGCAFDHEPPIDGEELIAFALRARKSPCHAGPKCRSRVCTLGHLCPNGPNCSRKNTCYFKKLHHIHPDVDHEHIE